MFRTLKDTPYVPLTNQKVKYIPTGIDTLDFAINDIQSGTVTIITGPPGCGKSTFIHSIMLGAIDRRFKVLLVDGEHSRDKLLNKLFSQVIGADSTLYRKVMCNKRVLKEPKPLTLDKLNKWFNDKFIVWHNYEESFSGDNNDYDEMFKLMNVTCKAHNVDIVFFDNLMSLVSSSQSEMNAKQSDFMKKCCDLSNSADVAVVLAAHPNGTIDIHREMSYYQISGTADLPNLATNILQVCKDPFDENGNIMADGAIFDLKNREFGEEPTILLTYDKETRSLCETHNESYNVSTYNWRMEGIQESEWERYE